MQAYERLEHAWAEWNGLDPVGMVACSSGTAALHLALEAMCLQPGSEVAMSDFNMVACPRAATLAGLSPVFVDCDEDLLIAPTLVDTAIDNNSSALLATHIYGRVCAMDMLSLTAERWGLWLIEDLAEAHGAPPHPMTDAACWSFYRNKIVAGEEGGAVWFADPEHAQLARQLRTLGFTVEHNYQHLPRGHNYRLSNCHAELILRSLSHVEENIARRREIEGWYDACCPRGWRMPRRDAVWVYDLRLPAEADVEQVVAALRRKGIEARCGFKPMHTQEEYRNCKLVAGSAASRQMARQVMYLPVQPGITTRGSVIRAFEEIHRILGR